MTSNQEVQEEKYAPSKYVGNFKPQRSVCCEMPYAHIGFQTDEFLEKTVYCLGCFERYLRTLFKQADGTWKKSYRSLSLEERATYGQFEIET